MFIMNIITITIRSMTLSDLVITISNIIVIIIIIIIIIINLMTLIIVTSLGSIISIGSRGFLPWHGYGRCWLFHGPSRSRHC